MFNFLASIGLQRSLDPAPKPLGRDEEILEHVNQLWNESVSYDVFVEGLHELFLNDHYQIHVRPVIDWKLLGDGIIPVGLSVAKIRCNTMLILDYDITQSLFVIKEKSDRDVDYEFDGKWKVSRFLGEENEKRT